MLSIAAQPELAKEKIRHKFLKQFPELESKCKIAKLFFEPLYTT